MAIIKLLFFKQNIFCYRAAPPPLILLLFIASSGGCDVVMDVKKEKGERREDEFRYIFIFL